MRFSWCSSAAGAFQEDVDSRSATLVREASVEDRSSSTPCDQAAQATARRRQSPDHDCDWMRVEFERAATRWCHSPAAHRDPSGECRHRSRSFELPGAPDARVLASRPWTAFRHTRDSDSPADMLEPRIRSAFKCEEKSVANLRDLGLGRTEQITNWERSLNGPLFRSAQIEDARPGTIRHFTRRHHQAA